MTGTRTQARQQVPLEAHVEQGLSGTAVGALPPPYEMRPLLTEQDRDAVAELVERRTRWLTDRWLTPAYAGDASALYREQWVDAVALFEDGSPVGCLRLNREPALPHWDAEIDETSLLVSLAYSAPDRKADLVGRLMTLWAQDFAGRLGVKWVRCEVPSGAPRDGTTRMQLLDHLTNVCGWQFVRSSKERSGRPLALLQLPAEPVHGLAPLIRCIVPLRPAASNPAEESST